MSKTKKVDKEVYDNTLKHLVNLKITTGFQSKQIDFLKSLIIDQQIVSLEALHSSLDRIELEHRRELNK